MPAPIVSDALPPASKPVTPPPTAAQRPSERDALWTYTWATIEAKNLLRCISIATDNANTVSDDLRPVIGIAVDGVARLLECISRQFEHIDVSEPTEASHG